MSTSPKQPPTMDAQSETKLQHQTTGALRVARRQSLYAFKEAVKAKNRLDMGMFDESEFGSVNYNILNTITSSETFAEQIEAELDKRKADYRTKEEILS